MTAAAMNETPSTTATTTPTTTNLQQGVQQDHPPQAAPQHRPPAPVDSGGPPAQQQEIVIPPSTATTTTTSGTTAPGTTTMGPTGSTTTGATTTTTTMPTTTISPTPGTTEKTDEVTKKEGRDERGGCDKAQKWRTYMEKALECGAEGMLTEFRLIRGHIPPFCTRQGFDANFEKNRFEDVVCVDQSRVQLNSGSYIHASWVNITANRKDILTQLPLPESGSEFWQMILDTDIQAILLILTHAEFNMFHANSVFPGEQDFLHFKDSHIRVGEFKRVIIDRDWSLHVISVRNSEKRRRYHHPHVYMSLSGCGRAGTYAAFEIAHERLHSDNFQKLNIMDCVCRARNGRMHSVQRTIQMQTIHAAIMEHIMGNKFATTLPPNLVQKYEEFSSRFNRCAELQQDLL
ncbi:hypothetical protein RB195_004690 [Necator americanus]|uniref:Tyrosine-protein phosphatase domain-containing protein n=1 Tax=Necator americanus TaxID=51031 RepID=A0ABR1BJ65_NECAM